MGYDADGTRDPNEMVDRVEKRNFKNLNLLKANKGF